MDKNFVNIDDLVRQRLGGGEEPERAGAWLQMRDLLDEEMPRDKAGFIFWRRLFSGIAVLALISTIGIGGYMYATSTKGNNNNNTINNNTPNSDLTINVSSAEINANEVSNSQQISTATISARMDITDNNHANKQNSEKATAIVKQTNKQILASNITTPTNNNANDNSNTKYNNKKHNREAKNPQFLSQLIAANERSKQQANNNATPIIGGATKTNTTGSAARLSGMTNHAAKTNNPGKTNSAKTSNSIAVTGNAQKSGRNMRADKKQKTSDAALASGSNSATSTTNKQPSAAKNPTSQTGNNIRTAANRNNNISIGKPALSSNASGTQNKRGINGANVINENSKLRKGNNRSAGATGTAQSATANNKNSGVNSKEIASEEMSKKTIERLHLSEHLINTSKGESYYKLDTILIDTVNEQLGLNTQSNGRSQSPLNNARNLSANVPGTPGISNASAGAVPIASAGAPNTSNASAGSPNIPGTSSMQSNSAAQSSANATILPAATASATGMTSMGIKENQVAKTGSGTTTAEKLSATFNDIKFHVASAQFAPGLTAGINGTFFGPASFKGFQFGVTGNFIFGDNFSILTELKYFERINNDYSINDNYYSYTPAGGGQYNKVLQPLSYSFSTLHSIELPVSIRYCKSHFNFFVGGNIVYSFAINTGASTPTVNTNAPVLVSAQGNDNVPKIGANDFDSRFGLGYLFGISYQISPNVMLDVRNVQTIWNNASTPGAKIISNQLYKSPSLQISIGYRFGGNKDKNKD